MQRPTGTHHTLLAHVAAGPELPTRLRFAERPMALLQAQSQALLSPALVLLRDICAWLLQAVTGPETPQTQGCLLCWAFGVQSSPDTQGLGQEILLSWAGLGWTGLGWAGPGWAGWAGLG